MSSERLRLALRDLAAGAAFAAMAISGQVPLWALAFFVAVLVVALAGRRPLADGRLSALALLAAVVVLYAAVVVEQLDLVVAACSTASMLTAQRMLSRPSPRTTDQVQLASLLMIAGGAVLSADLLFALCFFLYVVLAVLAQGLAVVAEAGPGPLPPVRRVLRPLGLGVALALLGALVFFILFPRLSWNVAARRGGASLGPATTGFADGLRLGGSGLLKSNPRVVFRARIDPDPGTDDLDAYWVGKRFDVFDGVQWSAPGRPEGPARQVVVGRPEPPFVRQEIDLLPAYGSRTLVALDRPAVFGEAETHAPTFTVRTELLPSGDREVRLISASEHVTYRAYSSADRSPAPMVDDVERSRRLQLPSRLDPRIPALARRLSVGAVGDRAIARQLERALQTDYAYTLELPGRVKDPLADFLFDRKAGHCEDFATALAVLLRARQIPARVVVGFHGGERAAGEYLVRAGDAHAWVEAEVDGHVLRLDATPPQHRSAVGSGLLGWLLARWEALQIRWLDRVVEYSFADQARLASEFRRGTGSRSRPESTTGRRDGSVAFALGLLGVALVVAALLGRRAAGGDTERLGRTLQRLLRRQGRLGPAGWLDRAQLDEANLAPVREGITRYREARFGRRPLGPGEGRRLARRARAALRSAPTPSPPAPPRPRAAPRPG
ncbi:MAG TPA: transglutaminaseTgpA domain-containing protein [Myxococcaceae bacterium]|nr:transglutaminaseTgpA domain-containing protein [Myxococcaceae bacterium]